MMSVDMNISINGLSKVKVKMKVNDKRIKKRKEIK